MSRGELECIRIAGAFAGVVLYFFLRDMARRISASFRDPVPPDEQPPTPVMLEPLPLENDDAA